MQAPFDLSGSNALVAGASRGRGLQMARALGAAGARVMLCARQPDALEQAVAQLQSEGIDARWCAADCSRSADIGRLVDETLQRMGEIDILINNAGLQVAAPEGLARAAASADPVFASLAVDAPAIEAASTLDASALPPDALRHPCVRSYALLSQAVVRRSMIGHGGGRIVQVVARPQPAVALAVLALTRTLARAWAGLGIGVNALDPHPAPAGALAAGWHAATLAARAAGCPDGADLHGITLLLASRAGQRLSGQCLRLGSAPGTRLNG